jgi:hypothetical protein
MLSFALSLALLAQAPTEAAAPAEPRHPSGAPRDDYQFVAWCYGALRGYLELHDEVMPEVKRIESSFRRPGSSLEADLKTYADMRKDGQAKLKQFQAALTAAEKASVRPINTVGAAAVRQGRSVWNAGPEVTKARKAQEWMSWALPAKCELVSASLEQRAKLMGSAFRVNEAPPAETPPADTPAAEGPPAEQATPPGRP